jgi:acyl-CoA dehydrogenase
MSDLTTFRAETRAWLEENCPSTCRGKDSVLPDIIWGGRLYSYEHPDLETWMTRLIDKGWTVPTWPKEYGGGGLSTDEAKVLGEEMDAVETRSPLYSFGISMLAPALMEYATEEQKIEHLPKVASGEIRWCQGYSEPGAGSDLASLQCKAVRDGDNYVVTGQKIWTSSANFSDWIFCLVRTDPSAPKHEGISFLLIDMASPGVSTKPIELISGASPFCETFFDEVQVPVANRIFEENKGWSVAKALLLHERTMLAGNGGRSSAAATRRTITQVARDAFSAPTGALPDARIRGEIAQLEMDQLCYGATLRRTTEAAKAGKGMGPEGSMFKLYLSELGQRHADLRQRINGANSLIWSGEDANSEDQDITREWLYGKASTILGGTSEVQLNIISKRVLGLPE